MARFFPLFPPRSASFSPQRRRSQSTPNGPKICCAPCTSSVRRYGFALLADMHLRLALALGAKWVSSIRSNRVPRLLIIAFAVGFFLGSSATGEAQKARHREQTGFSAEEAGVETPIAIPEDVL